MIVQRNTLPADVEVAMLCRGSQIGRAYTTTKTKQTKTIVAEIIQYKIYYQTSPDASDTSDRYDSVLDFMVQMRELYCTQYTAFPAGLLPQRGNVPTRGTGEKSPCVPVPVRGLQRRAARSSCTHSASSSFELISQGRCPCANCTVNHHLRAGWLPSLQQRRGARGAAASIFRFGLVLTIGCAKGWGAEEGGWGSGWVATVRASMCSDG
eukprot:3723928-Rhodomonas_salina.1